MRLPLRRRATDIGARLGGGLRRSIGPVTITCLLLGLAGCLAIFNATFHRVAPLAFVARQAVWLVAAAVVMLAAAGRGPKFWRRSLPLWATGAYAALLLVLLCGERVNGMRGWFAWHGVFIQPSELAKPIFLLCLASRLEYRSEDLRNGKGYLSLLGLFGLWAVPLLLQPDFGTLLVYGATFAVTVWCMGGRTWHLLATGLAAVPMVAAACLYRPYLWQRFAGFLDPEGAGQGAGWHILQFQRTLASGGAFDCSLGRGVWSNTYLPLGHSDSIFATLAEALGFFGVLPLVLLVLAWAWYGMRRAQASSRDRFVSGAVLGMSVMLTVQSLIHLSVNLGLMPPTGVTLPLISYGGSSLVSSLAMIGMVEGMTRTPDREE